MISICHSEGIEDNLSVGGIELHKQSKVILASKIRTVGLLGIRSLKFTGAVSKCRLGKNFRIPESTS